MRAYTRKGSKGAFNAPVKSPYQYRKPRTYDALRTHLPRTNNALRVLYSHKSVVTM